MGLLAFVYRSGNIADDCSLGGVSSTRDKFILTGTKELDNCPFDATEENELVYVEKVVFGKVIGYAYPKDHKTKFYSFGGNYLHTADSRFPFPHPIRIMDRYEGKA